MFETLYKDPATIAKYSHAPLLEEREGYLLAVVFLFNTGARASEAAGLQVEDLHLPERTGDNARATIHGKGGKIRIIPMWARTARALAALSSDRPAGSGSVSWSRHRKPYTRHGFIELVERAAARVPELEGRKITPHVLRHYLDNFLISGSGITMSYLFVVLTLFFGLLPTTRINPARSYRLLRKPRRRSGGGAIATNTVHSLILCFMANSSFPGTRRLAESVLSR